MPAMIEKHAEENGTFIIGVTFQDESIPPVAVVPTGATWTLSNWDGVVINNRLNVVITPLASTKYIVLSGADLALGAGEVWEALREFTVKWTYDSGSFGSNLPASTSRIFKVVARKKAP
jgi:hypothetical protein